MKKKKLYLTAFLLVLALALQGGIFSGFSVPVQAAATSKKQTGFVKKNGSWYYYDNYTDKNWIRQIQKQHSKITQNSNNSRIQKFSVYETTKSLVCKTHNAYKHICPFMRQYSIYHHFAFGNKFLFVCKYIQSYNGTDQKILHKDQDIKNTC